MQVLRRNIEKGLLCGSEKFIQKLEKLASRLLLVPTAGTTEEG